MSIGMVMVLLIIGSAHSVLAAPRVICDVEVITDTSARISLRWSDEATKTGIMITSWDFVDANQLVVYYKTGSDLSPEFSQRQITSEQYTFPMRVSLQASLGENEQFEDMTIGMAAYKPIMNLYYRGIISGYPEDHTFRPSNKVTRAEFSKMLLLSAKYKTDEGLRSEFKDVANDFWGRSYIMTLASKKILEGKGEGQFDPNGDITIGEVLTVLSRTFDLYDEEASYPYSLESHWSNEYFLDLVAEGLVIGDDRYYKPYRPNEKATREDCAVLLSRVLEHLHDVTQ